MHKRVDGSDIIPREKGPDSRARSRANFFRSLAGILVENNESFVHFGVERLNGVEKEKKLIVVHF
jgi:hypothetical protein